MPFTLSHPAAAVPLRKLGLPLSALVVGSLAPDFPYFFPPTTDSHFGHTLPGLLLLDVPLGFAILWLFHALLKEPLISLLPEECRPAVRAAGAGFRFRPLSRLLVIAVALAIGSVTHILWDGVTHYGGWAVDAFPFLHRPIVESWGKRVSPYKLLQHVSTILGGGLLALWTLRWLRAVAPGGFRIRARASWWAGVLFLIGCIAMAFGLVAAYAIEDGPPITTFRGLGAFLRTLAVIGLPLATLELVLFSIFWHIRRGRTESG
jgi:hypothetical protein